MSGCGALGDPNTDIKQWVMVVFKHPRASNLAILPRLRDDEVSGWRGFWNIVARKVLLLEFLHQPLSSFLICNRLGYHPMVGASIEAFDTSVLTFSLNEWSARCNETKKMLTICVL